MATTTKKRSLAVANQEDICVSDDPLNIKYQHLYYDILKYCSGSDLLELSCVNKFFYDLISKSSSEMRKIKLVIREDDDRRINKETLSLLSRSYRNIEVQSLYDYTHETSAVFRKFASTIEHVMSFYDVEVKGFRLNNLKTLRLYRKNVHNFRFLEDGLLTSTSNLKELHIYGQINCDSLFVNQLFKSSRSLEKLTIEGDAHQCQTGRTINLLTCHQERLQMQLKSFRTNATVRSCDNNYWYAFEHFIAPQQHYLTDLKIVCTIPKLVNLLHILENLTSLTFTPDNSNNNTNFRYPNENIMARIPLNKIKTANFWLIPSVFVKYFVAKSPLLEEIYIADISNEDFRYLYSASKKLKVIKFAYFDTVKSGYYDNQNEMFQRMRNDIQVIKI